MKMVHHLALLFIGVCACAERAETVLERRQVDAGVGAGVLVLFGGGAPRSLADLEALARASPPPMDGFVIAPRLEPFSNTPLDTSLLPPLFGRLKQPPFDTLTHHLVLVQVEGVDWFGPSAPLRDNLARLARQSREHARGLFVDTQTYVTQSFSLSSLPNRTFAEAEAAVRAQGLAAGQVLGTEWPGLEVVVTVGYSDVWRAVCLEGVSLETERYGLLPAFLDGLQDGLGANGVVIDGNLQAYGAREVAQVRAFGDASQGRHARLRGEAIDVFSFRFPAVPMAQWGEERRWPSPVIDQCPAATRDRLVRPLAFGLGLSLDYRAQAVADVGTTEASFSRNWRSPVQLEDTLAEGLRGARIVWLWSSVFDPFGRTTASSTPLPPAYLDAMARARARVAPR